MNICVVIFLLLHSALTTASVLSPGAIVFIDDLTTGLDLSGNGNDAVVTAANFEVVKDARGRNKAIKTTDAPVLELRLKQVLDASWSVSLMTIKPSSAEADTLWKFGYNTKDYIKVTLNNDKLRIRVNNTAIDFSSSLDDDVAAWPEGWNTFTLTYTHSLGYLMLYVNGNPGSKHWLSKPELTIPGNWPFELRYEGKDAMACLNIFRHALSAAEVLETWEKCMAASGSNEINSNNDFEGLGNAGHWMLDQFTRYDDLSGLNRHGLEHQTINETRLFTKGGYHGRRLSDELHWIILSGNSFSANLTNSSAAYYAAFHVYLPAATATPATRNIATWKNPNTGETLMKLTYSDGVNPQLFLVGGDSADVLLDQWLIIIVSFDALIARLEIRVAIAGTKPPIVITSSGDRLGLTEAEISLGYDGTTPTAEGISYLCWKQSTIPVSNTLAGKLAWCELTMKSPVTVIEFASNHEALPDRGAGFVDTYIMTSNNTPNYNYMEPSGLRRVYGHEAMNMKVTAVRVNDNVIDDAISKVATFMFRFKVVNPNMHSGYPDSIAEIVTDQQLKLIVGLRSTCSPGPPCTSEKHQLVVCDYDDYPASSTFPTKLLLSPAVIVAERWVTGAVTFEWSATSVKVTGFLDGLETGNGTLNGDFLSRELAPENARVREISTPTSAFQFDADLRCLAILGYFPTELDFERFGHCPFGKCTSPSYTLSQLVSYPLTPTTGLRDMTALSTNNRTDFIAPDSVVTSPNCFWKWSTCYQVDQNSINPFPSTPSLPIAGIIVPTWAIAFRFRVSGLVSDGSPLLRIRVETNSGISDLLDVVYVEESDATRPEIEVGTPCGTGGKTKLDSFGDGLDYLNLNDWNTLVVSLVLEEGEDKIIVSLNGLSSGIIGTCFQMGGPGKKIEVMAFREPSAVFGVEFACLHVISNILTYDRVPMLEDYVKSCILPGYGRYPHGAFQIFTPELMDLVEATDGNGAPVVLPNTENMFGYPTDVTVSSDLDQEFRLSIRLKERFSFTSAAVYFVGTDLFNFRVEFSTTGGAPYKEPDGFEVGTSYEFLCPGPQYPRMPLFNVPGTANTIRIAWTYNGFASIGFYVELYGYRDRGFNVFAVEETFIFALGSLPTAPAPTSTGLVTGSEDCMSTKSVFKDGSYVFSSSATEVDCYNTGTGETVNTAIGKHVFAFRVPILSDITLMFGLPSPANDPADTMTIATGLDLDQCARSCQTDSNCTGFEYKSRGSMECRLLKNVGKINYASTFITGEYLGVKGRRCEPNKYGPNCDLTCRCKEEICDVDTGACTECQTGYAGRNCDIFDVLHEPKTTFLQNAYKIVDGSVNTCFTLDQDYLVYSVDVRHLASKSVQITFDTEQIRCHTQTFETTDTYRTYADGPGFLAVLTDYSWKTITDQFTNGAAKFCTLSAATNITNANLAAQFCTFTCDCAYGDCARLKVLVTKSAAFQSKICEMREAVVAL